MKLLDLENLARGTESQKLAYQALSKLDLFEKLGEYSPVLAGAYPLDLDVCGSEIQVVCSTQELESFADRVAEYFGDSDQFELHHTIVRDKPAVLVRFEAEGYPIAILTQQASVFTQPAVVLMLLEARLLTFAPKEAKAEIRALRESGMETESAFAQCFEIEGDPYEELLAIARLPDHEILFLTHRFRFRTAGEGKPSS